MISIFIISFYRFDQTWRCLKSLRKNLSCHYEVVLVENASADSHMLSRLQSLQKNWPRLTLIALNKQLPCPHIRSRVLDWSKGEYIFFLDNDCFIEKDFFADLLSELEKDSKIGGISPALLYYPSRTCQCVGIELKITNADVFHPRHMYHGLPYDEIKTQNPFRTDFIPGGCSLFKRSFLEKNRYDEKLKNIMGDYDICLQGKSKGYEYWVHPGCYVLHNKESSKEEYLHAKAAISDWQGGVLRFYKKWNLLYYIYPEFKKGNIELHMGQFPRWKPKEQRC